MRTPSKYSTVGLALFASVALSFSASAATVVPNIQYSFTGIFAGTLNGVSFNAPVRISMLSNTASNTSSSSTSGLTTTTIYRLFGETSIDIGDDGIGVVTMTRLSALWTTPVITASRSTTIGINSTTVALGYFNPAPPSTQGRTTFGTNSGSSYDFSGPQSYTFVSNPTSFQSIETSGGTLSFSSGGRVTLNATAVPEPSAAALLGLGALALVKRRKR
ncbi:MAG: PEP-CTERM sorting domain-containing protein [Verrucomicrobiota bacterium]